MCPYNDMYIYIYRYGQYSLAALPSLIRSILAMCSCHTWCYSGWLGATVAGTNSFSIGITRWNDTTCIWFRDDIQGQISLFKKNAGDFCCLIPIYLYLEALRFGTLGFQLDFAGVCTLMIINVHTIDPIVSPVCSTVTQLTQWHKLVWNQIHSPARCSTKIYPFRQIPREYCLLKRTTSLF